MSLNIIIGFYMFISIGLLAFNIAYILRSKGKTRRRIRLEAYWHNEIAAESALEAPPSPRHASRMERRLKNVDQLMAYHEAALKLLPQPNTRRYLDSCLPVFQALAVSYGRAPAMERAFFAHVISVYHPGRERGCGQLPDIMMEYFEDSTVFCRENLLQAFYSMGRPGPIIRAFSVMSERGWYHHTRLLSDGLSAYPGDKEELAWQLWRGCRDWREQFQVAAVQFASDLSSSFSGEFLAALEDNSLPLETRFALVRYFQRRPYPEAMPVLLDILRQDGDSGLAIAAASALAGYPGAESRDGLLSALHSRNWYIRHNAALALVRQGVTDEEFQDIRASGDRYALEMLNYALMESGRAAKKEAAV